MVSNVVWSPDGQYIATAIDGVLTIVDAATGNFRTFETPSVSGSDFSWSPDSQTIAFISDNNIYTIALDGSNLLQVTSDSTWKRAVKWAVP